MSFNTKNKAISSLRTFRALVTRDQYNHKEGGLYNGKKRKHPEFKKTFALISQSLFIKLFIERSIIETNVHMGKFDSSAG